MGRTVAVEELECVSDFWEEAEAGLFFSFFFFTDLIKFCFLLDKKEGMVEEC